MRKRPFSKRPAGIISTFQSHRSIGENIQLWLGLGRVLDHLKYEYRCQVGYYRNEVELSYVVYNVTKEFLEDLAVIYDQNCFIYKEVGFLFTEYSREGRALRSSNSLHFLDIQNAKSTCFIEDYEYTYHIGFPRLFLVK